MTPLSPLFPLLRLLLLLVLLLLLRLLLPVKLLLLPRPPRPMLWMLVLLITLGRPPDTELDRNSEPSRGCLRKILHDHREQKLVKMEWSPKYPKVTQSAVYRAM